MTHLRGPTRRLSASSVAVEGDDQQGVSQLDRREQRRGRELLAGLGDRAEPVGLAAADACLGDGEGVEDSLDHEHPAARMGWGGQRLVESGGFVVCGGARRVEVLGVPVIADVAAKDPAEALLAIADQDDDLVAVEVAQRPVAAAPGEAGVDQLVVGEAPGSECGDEVV